MGRPSAVMSLLSAAAHSAGHSAASSVSDRRGMRYRLEAELYVHTFHHQFEKIETDRYMLTRHVFIRFALRAGPCSVCRISNWLK